MSKATHTSCESEYIQLTSPYPVFYSSTGTSKKDGNKKHKPKEKSDE